MFDDAWLNGVPSSTSELAKKFMADMDPQAVRWRTLRIPVEIPLRRHLTTVRLTPAAQGTLYEGRALPFDIELTTSLAWLGDQSPDNIRVTYDVQASVDDWVVIGKKRGIYTASVSDLERPKLTISARQVRDAAHRACTCSSWRSHSPSCICTARRSGPERPVIGFKARHLRDVHCQCR